MIVCLGWGSLVWDPKELPLADRHPDTWREDGPKLPVEFARVSKNGRLTLVIDPSSPSLSVLWNVLVVDSLADAVEALRVREEAQTEQTIGRWPAVRLLPFTEVIGEWALSRGIEGVVWTALGPKFADGYQRPSCEQAVRYLAELPKTTQCLAEEYIRRAPIQIDTPYRRAIEKTLGWTPLP